MYRVHQLLKQLDYQDLTRRGVIPDLGEDALQNLKSYRFAPWVYAAQRLGAPQIFSHLGIFYDYMTRKMIAGLFPVPWGEEPLEEKTGSSPELRSNQQRVREVLSLLQDPAVAWKSVVPEVFEISAFYFPPGEGRPLTLHKGAGAPYLDSEGRVSCPSAGLYPALGSLNKFLQETFSPCRSSGLAFNQELSDGCLSGHPDLLADGWILDIKAVQNFKNTAPRCMMQVFAYVALARAQGRSVSHAGILLALQQETFFVDVSEWDSGPFLGVLLGEIRRLERGADPGRDSRLAREAMGALAAAGRGLLAGPERRPATAIFCAQDNSAKNQHPVPATAIFSAPNHQTEKFNSALAAPDSMGWHTEKVNGSFFDSFCAFLARVEPSFSASGCYPPCQIYLQPAKSGAKAKATPADIQAAAELVAGVGLRVFSHAPLIINLSNPVTKLDPEDTTFIISLLKRDLRLCRELGGRGCVVHCGKPKGQSYQRALRKMEETIREVLPEASAETPLLLETPAGDKGEVCVTFEEFSSFYRRFEGDPRLKVCIDTAHVWGAGYWPLDYLSQWEETNGTDSLGLVHFNDSRRERGSRKDEHQLPGRGHIGFDHMLLTALWCEERGVPYVHE